MISFDDTEIDENDLLNIKNFSDILDLSRICSDNNSAAKMNDKAALYVFHPKHIPELLEHKRYTAVLASMMLFPLF